MNPNDLALTLGATLAIVALSLGFPSALVTLGAFGAGLWLAKGNT